MRKVRRDLDSREIAFICVCDAASIARTQPHKATHRQNRHAMSRVLFLLLSLLAHSAFAASAPRYESYPPRELEPASDPRTWMYTDVQNWIESVGFFEYRDAVMEAKLTGKQLLRATTRGLHKMLLLASEEHAATLSMEIGELRARRGLLNAQEQQEHYAAHPLAESWDSQGVFRFLTASGLGKYAQGFAGIDGRGLLRMGEGDVRRVIEAYSSGELWEEGQAAAEQLNALIGHLRWRSKSVAGRKDEL